MKTLIPLIQVGFIVVGLTIANTGCETRERVVVRNPPPPPRVYVAPAAPPVVEEKVIVR